MMVSVVGGTASVLIIIAIVVGTTACIIAVTVGSITEGRRATVVQVVINDPVAVAAANNHAGWYCLLLQW